MACAPFAGALHLGLSKAISAGSEGSAPGTHRAPVLIRLFPETLQRKLECAIGQSLRVLPGCYLGDAGAGRGCPGSSVCGVHSVHMQGHQVNYREDLGPDSLLVL